MHSCHALSSLDEIITGQVRIATRLGTPLVSSDFKSRDYYPNIRKAITAGYFMQVRCCPPECLARGQLSRHSRTHWNPCAPDWPLTKLEQPLLDCKDKVQTPHVTSSRSSWLATLCQPVVLKRCHVGGCMRPLSWALP